MSDDGDYELLPHEELEYLRNEIHKIKRNPIQGYKQADDLKESIDKLNTSINNLITLFSNTNDELVDAFKKTTIEEHFDKLSSQNEQIAQGILAVAKLVEDSDNHTVQTVPLQKASPQAQTSPILSSDLTPSAMADITSIPDDLNLPISSSMGSAMSVGKTQSLSNQVPSFPDNNLPLMDSSLPDSLELPSQDLHPLNSQNLNMSTPSMGMGEMDLPPPPEKKKGLLGMFK